MEEHINQAATIGKENTLAELKTYGYTDFELGYIGRIIDGEEISVEEDELFQEYRIQEWIYQQNQNSEGIYEYIGSKDVEIDGSKNKIHESKYTYADKSGDDIQEYLVFIKSGNNLYEIRTWTLQGYFEGNKETLENIIRTFVKK